MTFSTPQDIDPARYRLLWDAKEGLGPVIYWMSREQRAHDNWGLLLAQQKGLELKRPVMVIFCLTTEYPGANRRHYGFLLRGLAQLPKYFPITIWSSISCMEIQKKLCPSSLKAFLLPY